jgi:hypothetical protein
MVVVIGSVGAFMILCEVIILMGGAEKKHEKYSIMIVGVPPEVQILTGMKRMLIDMSPIKLKSLFSMQYIIVSLQCHSNTSTDQFFQSAFMYYHQN